MAILAILPGKSPISQITNADLMRFARMRRAQVSNGTTNRQLQFLGRAIRHMSRIHGAKVPELHFRAAETPEPEERVRELAWSEQERLFEQLRPDLHPFVKFALLTGARRSTICRLKWSDIDLDAGPAAHQRPGMGLLQQMTWIVAGVKPYSAPRWTTFNVGRVAGLGPQLFPGWEDSTGRHEAFRKSSSAVVPGQMSPCQPARATHGECCLLSWTHSFGTSRRRRMAAKTSSCRARSQRNPHVRSPACHRSSRSS